LSYAGVDDTGETEKLSAKRARYQGLLFLLWYFHREISTLLSLSPVANIWPMNLPFASVM
jgi:hypothetical protein